MNEMSDAAALLAFDDIVVDAEDFTVTKSGELVTLTPRAFDVLAYLVRNRGRVVEKQEIFDAIWKDTFITDNALTRVMKEIRGVLGDRATEPRYIETVHKRGYRFIAEVSVGGRDRGRPSATGPIGSANAASQPVARKRSFPKYLPHVIGFFVAVAAIAGFYAGQNRTTFRSIAVLPLTNESGDANVEYLADGITETLIGSLSQLTDVKVKSRSSVFPYKDSQVGLKTIGRELGVEAVLTGRVVQRDDALTLYLSLIDPATENNLWSKQYTRRMEGLIALQSEIANDVAASLGATVGDEKQVLRSYPRIRRRTGSTFRAGFIC